MEKDEKKQSKVCSIRMSNEDKRKFDEILEAKDCSSEKLINDLITKYEQDDFKLNHPEHSQVIDRFDSYESAIRRIFESLIFDFDKQRELIKMEFCKELTEKDKLIADLTNEKQTLKDSLSKRDEDISDSSKTIEDLNRQCETLEKVNKSSLNEIQLLKDNISSQESFRDLYLDEKDKVSKLNESIFEKENKINDLMEKVNDLKIENSTIKAQLNLLREIMEKSDKELEMKNNEILTLKRELEVEKNRKNHAIVKIAKKYR